MKNIGKIVRIGSSLLVLGLAGACVPGQTIEGFFNSPLETASKTMRYVYGGDMGNGNKDNWPGTAIVNVKEFDNGKIMFWLDRRKLGRGFDIDYLEDELKIIDPEKYDKTWSWYEEDGEKNGFIITYTPK